MNIIVETVCKPTEDKDKVKTAMFNIFPDLRINCEELKFLALPNFTPVKFVNNKGNKMIGTSSSLEGFKEILRESRIRDTASRILLRGREGNKTVFRINKQVAFVGKVCFAEEKHPLGDITVTIEDENIDRIIEEITRKEGV